MWNSLTGPSGINFAFASSLLSRQCNVVFADLALRPEAKEIVAKHSSSSRASAKAVFQKTDVRQWQDLVEMFKVAEQTFGGADIVCPGAGVYEPVSQAFMGVLTDDSCARRYYVC